MANYNNYTIFYGYCINSKWSYINDIEQSDKKFWDGIPEFSLNYSNNKIGYKIVKDNLGKEELYFGVSLLEWDDYEECPSRIFNPNTLKEKYQKLIDEKYRQLFTEKPKTELSICIISECM